MVILGSFTKCISVIIYNYTKLVFQSYCSLMGISWTDLFLLFSVMPVIPPPSTCLQLLPKMDTCIWWVMCLKLVIFGAMIWDFPSTPETVIVSSSPWNSYSEFSKLPTSSSSSSWVWWHSRLHYHSESCIYFFNLNVSFGNEHVMLLLQGSMVQFSVNVHLFFFC